MTKKTQKKQTIGLQRFRKSANSQMFPAKKTQKELPEQKMLRIFATAN